MIEVALNKIEKYYGANKVLDDITFEVNTGERVGLIGGNGTGKTTILKIIAGIEAYNNGTLSIRKGATIGYLDQIPDYPQNYRVIDVLNTAFQKIHEMKEEMIIMEKKMTQEEGEELERLMKNYGKLQTLYEHKGGYETEAKLSRIATGLKLSEAFMERKFETLSGGEKTTVVLGRILLENPNILLLDEPSNHLDIESVQWLEGFLEDYQGTVIVISHDRYFLDRVINRVVEVELGEVDVYKGHYSYYVEEKRRRLLEQFESYKNQQKKIKAMEDAIKRFRDWGTRADNEKMFIKARNMEKRLDKMDKVDRPLMEKKKIQLEFSGNDRSGKEVFRLKGIEKSFDNQRLFSDLNLLIAYGEKVALLGKNGSGKSTLLKIILGQYPSDKGTVTIGSRVKLGYLEQDVSFHDEETTVLEAFRRMHPMMEGRARGILAKFLFYQEDVYKKVEGLSGGEKTRLRFCQLMYEDINTLILDEPTNHLDVESREMLEEALANFEGTVFFISHDRYFINKIADRIVEIEDNKLHEFLGSYDFYREEKQKRMVLEEEVKEPVKQGKREKSVPSKDRQDTGKQIKELERRIEVLEGLIDEKEQEMEGYGDDYEKLNSIFKEKEGLVREMEELITIWTELNTRI